MQVNRPGRPEMTHVEAEAMKRIAKSHDGQLFLARLAKVREKHRDADLQAEGSESDKYKGRVLEILDIEREFQDAQQEDTHPRANPQWRFA